MPVALSTKFTGFVALPLDNSNLAAGEIAYRKPKDSDPVFEVRFISELQSREINSATLAREELMVTRRKRISELIAPHIVSTRNMGEAKSGIDALDLLTDGEVEDLASQIWLHSKLGYDEIKKSKLPPSSGPVASAQNAAAGAATTSQAPSTPTP